MIDPRAQAVLNTTESYPGLNITIMGTVPSIPSHATVFMILGAIISLLLIWMGMYILIKNGLIKYKKTFFIFLSIIILFFTSLDIFMIKNILQHDKIMQQLYILNHLDIKTNFNLNN